MPLPHERLPGETAKAFAAFVEYLRLGPQRSQEKAAENLRKSVGTLRKWAERNAWVRRAAEYDELCVAQEREVQAVLVKEKAVDWVRRQERLKEQEWAAAEEAIALCRQRMGELAGLPAGKTTLADIAKLLDVASKLARLATGMETDRRELTGKDGGPVKVEVDVAPLIKRVYGSESDVPILERPVIDCEAGGSQEPAAIQAGLPCPTARD